MKSLHERTGRAVIVYATSWLESRPGVPDEDFAIGLKDVQGFMEAVSNVKERELDFILHSPGGRPEAAESIVEYLRTRFDHIRVVVPLAAMSAATMIALAADEIMMGSHSQLGPIDPQFILATPEGPRSAPGQAILDQFELAKDELSKNPQSLAAWLPILRSYLRGLIAQCRTQGKLSESYVSGWLQRFMFKEDTDREEKAKKAAAWFADFKYFGSHGRRVSREDARAQGIRIVDLEADQDLQNAMLSVHHAVQHTFLGTGATKVIENHLGRAWITMTQTIPFAVAPTQQSPPGEGVGPEPPEQPPSSRPERRRQQREARKGGRQK